MSTCSRCGAGFECGMVDGKSAEPCWCSRLPPLPAGSLPLNGDKKMDARCFCPDCLRALMESSSDAPPDSSTGS
ncbi:cysteine-rich CWC family protein [Noviherbaspirillum massiliense]|uniref:cysteine-rich CWC family protein n=1 Tax=Noviherbaspirillum massiliense TaxID=1465823 RepID=UPI000946B185|nr:cysteine-rich CWC family protein [Noviherbaspirillum massiliense]